MIQNTKYNGGSGTGGARGPGAAMDKKCFSVDKLQEVSSIDKVIHEIILRDSIKSSHLEFIRDQFQFHMLMKETSMAPNQTRTRMHLEYQI